MNYHTSLTEASFPRYVTGLANVSDQESMIGAFGYYTEIKKLTDLDGSIWWWLYPDPAEYGKPKRNHIAGKCAWASGVFAALFVSDLLGIKYDAPSKSLTFRPFSPTSNFSWNDLKLGTSLFDLEYIAVANKTMVSLTNRNEFSVDLNLEVLFDSKVKSIRLNQEIAELSYEQGKFLGTPTIKVARTLLPSQCVKLVITG